ncbi:MAG: alpha-L-rhamnosidase C-terminal domain-containing protein [Chitinophagales bacterium]
MNSFNHYAYGAIGDWMYRVVAGLDTYSSDPGYKHSMIQPRIGGGLSFASANLETNYGRLSSSWRTEGNNILMLVEIPANTRATVYIPASNADAVTEDGRSLSTAKEIKAKEVKDGYVQVEIGSGVYHFNIKK